MKYICLGYLDPRQVQNMSESERRRRKGTSRMRASGPTQQHLCNHYSVIFTRLWLFNQISA